MYINAIMELTSRAWCLTILALIYEGVPARQAPLLARSGANRGAFSQSLNHLIALKLLERNPGHGHPLRPEFRLTKQGERWAQRAAQINQLVLHKAQTQLLRRSWTIPILTTAGAEQYFSQLKKQLSPITDRALSQKLTQLQDCNWISREVDTHMHPPRTLYRAINEGAVISKIMREHNDFT